MAHPNKSSCYQHDCLQSSASSTLAVEWTFPNAIYTRHLHALKTSLIITPYPNTFKIKFKFLSLANKVHCDWAPSDFSRPIPHPRQWDELSCVSYWKFRGSWPHCSHFLESPSPSVSLARTLCSNQAASSLAIFRELLKQREVDRGDQKVQHPVSSHLNLRVINMEMSLSWSSTCYYMPGTVLSAFISHQFLATTLWNTNYYRYFTEEQTKA